MQNIKHHTDGKNGSFYYEADGQRLAQMVYHMGDSKTMVIEHTEVDKSLQGKGIGKKLLEELVSYVRLNGIKVIPLCPFANATFQKVKEWQDVLANVGIKYK